MLSAAPSTPASATADSKKHVNEKLNPVIKKVMIQILEDYIARRAENSDGNWYDSFDSLFNKGKKVASTFTGKLGYNNSKHNIEETEKYIDKIKNIDNPESNETLLDIVLELCNVGRGAAEKILVHSSQFTDAIFAISNYLNCLENHTNEIYTQSKHAYIKAAKEDIEQILNLMQILNKRKKEKSKLFRDPNDIRPTDMAGYNDLVMSLAYLGDHTYLKDDKGLYKPDLIHTLFPPKFFSYPDAKTPKDLPINDTLPFILQLNWVEHYLRKYRTDLQVNRSMIIQFEKKANPKALLDMKAEGNGPRPKPATAGTIASKKPDSDHEESESRPHLTVK